MTMLELRAQLRPVSDGEGTVHARLVPYGHTIDHGGRQVRFAQGAIRHGDPVPVNLDHGAGALERIGLATDYADYVDGLYVRLAISDTAAGRDTLTLLRDGVLTDVSAGVWLDADQQGPDFTGTLDHVAIVGKGAFGNAGEGSKVLAVHASEEEAPMEAHDQAPEATTDDQLELAELRQDVTALRADIANLQVQDRPVPMSEQLAALFTDEGGTVPLLWEGALAASTTTEVAGVVPDFQTFELLSILDTQRPFIATLPRGPIGDHGMTVDWPKVSQKPAVGIQATQNTEVTSQQFTIGVKSVDLKTYAGANILSRQSVDRSRPGVVQALFREFASEYAQVTEADAIADAAAAAIAAGNTAILADLGASGTATFDAFAVAAGEISKDVRTPATDVVVATDRWQQLQSLADADGRPLLVYGPNGPQNAQGQTNFNSNVAQYHGLTVHHSPSAAAGTCYVYTRNRSGNWLEQNPIDLSVAIVSTLSWELGVYGIGAYADLYEAGGYAITAA